MQDWLKVNALGLVLGVFGIVGVYSSLETKTSNNSIRLSEVEQHVFKLDKIVDTVPVLKAEFDSLAGETKELKPILVGLSSSINKLNITLANSNGSIAVSNEKINTIKTTQDKILKRLDELR